MRFLLASAVLVATATAGLRPDEMACSIKNSYVVDAINKLCSKYDMVAPSDYSSSGVKSDPPYAWVAINGMSNFPKRADSIGVWGERLILYGNRQM